MCTGLQLTQFVFRHIYAKISGVYTQIGVATIFAPGHIICASDLIYGIYPCINV